MAISLLSIISAFLALTFYFSICGPTQLYKYFNNHLFLAPKSFCLSQSLLMTVQSNIPNCIQDKDLVSQLP